MFRLARATVLVSDQDRAIDFYVNTLGCTLQIDAPFGDGLRWIEVRPPQGDAVLVLYKPHMPEMGQPGSIHNVLFETDDVRGVFETLKARGVKITLEHWQPEAGPPLFQFADPDGNTFMIAQRYVPPAGQD